MPDARTGTKKFPGSPPELIVMAKTSAALRSAGQMVSAAPGTGVSSLNSLLKSYNISLHPLFDVSEERVKMTMNPSIVKAQMEAYDPSTFYFVRGATVDLAKLALDLRNESAIEAAFIVPPGEPPVCRKFGLGLPAPAPQELGATPTPDFTTRQNYLGPAPAGVNARFAWTQPGGKGTGIQVIDLEWGWNFSHEDLLGNQGGIVGGVGSSTTDLIDHGTSVLGVFRGDLNTFGITGIAPESNMSAIALPEEEAYQYSTATAISMAAKRLRPGNIILLEIHLPGPRCQFHERDDQLGYIAVEWWPHIFTAIAYATSLGVIVIEAAGNGAEDLDDPIYNTPAQGFPSSWRNPFNPANAQCGAIVCGAGAPPPGTHGRDLYGADRSRLDFSNYGSRIDAQGWGREVTTTCAPDSADLYNGGPNACYTDGFSGTSSASPVIVGVTAAAQGMLLASGKPLLTPASVRDLLRETGSPQQDGPSGPTTQRIGNRPDLRRIHENLF